MKIKSEMFLILLFALLFQFHAILSSDQETGKTNQCDYRYCENGTRCIYTETSIPGDCVCIQGYRGKNCSDTNECKGGQIDPCLHRGYCENTIGNYSCHCLSSWEGRHCQDRSNLTSQIECLPGYSGNRCELALCANGYPLNSTMTGQNNTVTSKNYTCYCKRGWDKTHSDDPCNLDIDECTQYPSICKNGGNCTNTNGSYICECLKPWDGENCTYYNSCMTNTCGNEGTCRKTGADNETTYECVCEIGYEGKNCTEDIDECSLNTTAVCFNGNCTNTVGSYNCTCETGWTGKNCNITLYTTITTEEPARVSSESQTNNIYSSSTQSTPTHVFSSEISTYRTTKSTYTAASTEDPDEKSRPKTKQKDGTPIIIGAGVGGLVIVIAACIVGYFLYKRKRGRVGTVNIAGDNDKNEKFNIERISKTDDDLDTTHD